MEFFFTIQQQVYNRRISDKATILFKSFNECAARCAYLSPHTFPEGQYNVHIWHHRKFIGDPNWNQQKWCYCQSKKFSGKSGNARHLKTFRIISNYIPSSLLSHIDILVLCSCIPKFSKSLCHWETQVSFLENK